MERRRKLYPIGIQTFSEIIEKDYLYIDKTEYIYKLTHSDEKFVFLSRPRRFGKSLLVSTLRSYFEGKKDLFKGLAIEKLENEWREYPVIHLDMSGGKHLNKEALERYLLFILSENAKRLGVRVEAEDTNIALSQLITEAAEKYKQQVVVLLDEYDAPLLDVMHNTADLETLRSVMRNFYSPLKMCEKYLRFVLITGITKFSQLSIFSELNNIKNKSMMKDCAAICGITEEEMLTQMGDGIEDLAQEQGISKEEAFEELKQNYDGYHFTWPSPDIYNPYSLLNALADKELNAYWFGSGTPTFLIEMLRKFHVSPAELSSERFALKDDFDAPTEAMTTITPLLYQSGYITIKNCNKFGKYTLGMPNKEIRIGLMRSMLPNYLGKRTENGGAAVSSMQEALYNDNINEMFRLLQTFLSTIPKVDYVEQPEHFEAHWQQMLLIIFTMLGAYCDVEVKTATGRIDLVARTQQKIYLIELKVNQTAGTAMEQIDLKEYDRRFALCNLPVVKVGVNFSEEKRNITEWKIAYPPAI